LTNISLEIDTIDASNLDILYVDTYDTELSKWETINNYKSLPNETPSFQNPWISNKTTGISYQFQNMENGVIIFDTINFAWTGSISNPRNLFPSYYYLSYHVPVLLQNGQILYIGGKSSENNQTLMNRILSYDTLKDSWQINNTTGNTPGERKDHTAVLTSDGQVIVYGGESNLSIPAIPYLAVLNTSKTPYMWLTPIEENSIGSLAGHTSVMFKNYMITAFAPITFYQLLDLGMATYKWSLVSNSTNAPLQIPPIHPIQSNLSGNDASFDRFNNFSLNTRWIVTILVIVVA
ncbi:10993_t:CDS:2, partial [Cetraspora pellucida]